VTHDRAPLPCKAVSHVNSKQERELCACVTMREGLNLESKRPIWMRTNCGSFVVYSMRCVASYLVVQHAPSARAHIICDVTHSFVT